MPKTQITAVTLLVSMLLIIGACAPAQTSSLPSTNAKMASTSEDIEWLATVITSEAGSVYWKGNWVRCTDEERAAVGWTVLNRFKNGTFGQTIKEVVTAPGQYAYKQEPTSEIRELAKKLLEGQIPDATGGATYFFSPISMPKDGESTTGFDIGGGLHKVTGIDSMVYFPSWATTMTYIDDLKNVKQAYFMFYRSMTVQKTEPTKEQMDVTPSSNELFVLGKEGVYRETSSAKGNLKITVNEVKYSPEGAKYWLLSFQNITNRVLDVELFVDWKDASGKSIDTRNDRSQRFLPESEWDDGFEFPVGALGPMFWMEVREPKPIPSHVTLNYSEAASAKGKIKLGESSFSIDKEKTVYEHWKLDGIRMENTSSNVLIQVNIMVEFYSPEGQIGQRSLQSSLGYIQPGETEYILKGLSLPYDATELRLSVEVAKILPSQVTVNFDIDPSIEGWKTNLGSPKIKQGSRWVVDGNISPGVKYGFPPNIGLKFYVEFDKGNGELTMSGYTSPTVGNPIDQNMGLDGHSASDLSGSTFSIIYPLEATHANVRITRIY
ncbi:MAG: hypothetical protein A2Z28_06145 [Chloroflexi bacterium RBG_16_51_9]|nr:MAG: hypothetical protein A2Z28_06145 [Chloroflexi bacterium RBG_16_51_9]